MPLDRITLLSSTQSDSEPKSPSSIDNIADFRTYLSLGELANQTTLSKSTLTRLFRQGKITGYQPGGPRTRVIFPRDAIEQAVQTSLHESSQQHPPTRLSGPTPRWKKAK